MKSGSQWIMLAGLVALCLAVGALSGWVTAPAVAEWYPTLVKPSWNPPSWLFAPVWTTLYVTMAVAAWLVWRRGNATVPLLLFFAQLLLNSAWSFLFFGARSPWLGLADIAMLWLVLAITTYVFFTRSKLAGALMLPYLAWVSFAAVLNFTIWRLN